jgi:predicted DNA-binding transcriptional regulator YafY
MERRQLNQGIHKEVAFAVTAGRKLQLCYCDAYGQAHQDVVIPVGIQCVEGTEYVLFRTRQGTGTLRLDLITSLTLL